MKFIEMLALGILHAERRNLLDAEIAVSAESCRSPKQGKKQIVVVVVVVLQADDNRGEVGDPRDQNRIRKAPLK